MPTSRLPIDIKNFLNDNIDSVTHLEVLLMLYKESDTEWNAASVAKELRTNESSAGNYLSHLAAKNLLLSRETKFYQYKPGTPELTELIPRLCDLYKEMPVAIVTCIFEKPKDKLKDLSDAFRLKKD